MPNKPLFFYIMILLALITGGSATYIVLVGSNKIFTPEKTPADIALVNLTTIKNNALAFKSLNELLTQESKKFQEEITTLEMTIRKEYQDLSALKKLGKIPDAALREKKEALEQKTQQLDKEISGKKDLLNKRINELSVVLEDKIKKIVQKFYEELDLDIVLNATILDFPVVLNNKPYLDITDQVLAELDRELPSLTINLNTSHSQ